MENYDASPPAPACRFVSGIAKHLKDEVPRPSRSELVGIVADVRQVIHINEAGPIVRRIDPGSPRCVHETSIPGDDSLHMNVLPGLNCQTLR
ncbi:hypothetical protein V1460_00810 [Streptomyces sp. SCSIO 30461]|uniref:hypothetical protein n=1 Tax=Streptomyces sp. SCSIO 30461 TaxID=3118085 RepID=UPI0030CD1DDB